MYGSWASQRHLVGVEGERIARPKVRDRGDVQHVKGTVRAARGVLRGQPLSNAVNFGPFGGDNHHRADGKVVIEIAFRLRDRLDATRPHGPNWGGCGGSHVGIRSHPL